MMRSWLAAVLLLLGAAAARAEPADRNWLPPGSELGGALADEPRPVSAIRALGGTPGFLVTLGELAFQTPELLGPKAGQAGLACRSCHPGGDRNPRFFIPGASRHPGGFDGTTGLLSTIREDGIDNPLQIPSLRGIRFTAPYGHDGRMSSLREFTRHVIVEEFAGRAPLPIVLDALVAYLLDLDFLPNRLLGTMNRLRDAAPAPATRGEGLFERYCAGCHIPSAQFVDRRSHDVGTGGSFDTPSLRGVALRDRFFHDGRTASLDEAVEQHLRALGVGMDASHRNDLLAYLAAVGDGEQPNERVTLPGRLQDLERHLALLDRTLADEDRELTGFVVDALRGELGRIADRFEPERETAAAAARLLREIARLEPPAAARKLAELRQRLRRTP